MSQEDLAHALLISRPYVSMIEAGTKPVAPVLVAKIADVLAVKQIALIRDGCFDPHAAELLSDARKVERALADTVAGLREEIAELSAKAKEVV